MPLPTLLFDVGFNTSPTTGLYLHLDDTVRGRLDTNTLAPDVFFTDISAKVHGFSTQRTSNRVAGPVLRFEAGSLSADLNNTDRSLDPSVGQTDPQYAAGYTAGGYVTGSAVVAGVTAVTPMRAVRVRATWGGVTYPLWRGFADSWLPGYIKGDTYASVALTATDGFKVLGNNTRPAGTAVGLSELSGARIRRILDSASWPAADRLVDAGQSTLQATTLDGDALSETQLVSDTEVGAFYIDGSGRAVFRDRYAIYRDARSNTSQAVFGDDSAGIELRYVDIQPSFDDEQMVNQTLITIANGSNQQISQDATSVSQYLYHSHERSDLLMQADTVAADYGRYIVYMSKDPEYRFDSLGINPLADPVDLFPQVLGREVGDRITVRRRPPGGGSLIERDVFIVGINHDVDFRVGTWMTTWQLQSASRFAFLTLDHATLGKLDSNALTF
jgi:hypothetical protein